MEHLPIKKEGAKEYVPTYEQQTAVPAERRFYDIKNAICRFEFSDENTGDFEISDTCRSFALDLARRHSDIRDYSLFHILSGSTPPEGTPKVDLEGEDSILAFIERLAKEHQIQA
jgi:hypothetical protein